MNEKLRKNIKKAIIETKPYYYTEDEVDLIVETKGRKDSFKVSIRNIKGTINFLEDKKKRLEEEIAKIQEEIEDNQQWLEDIKPELAKIKYFKFEE